MANEQHLARLKQSIPTWNQWRQRTGIRPDFTGADLSWLDLGGADLRDADLSWANFHKSVLARANLAGALLREANLDGANLRGANLRLANLTAAVLGTMDLEGARLFDTVLADVDLGEVQNLENCVHDGPSVLDHRTLEKSGKVPVVFLRGCGLSEPLIAFAPTLSSQALPPSCFISHVSRDRAFVERLSRDLQTMGVRCWRACEESHGRAKRRIGIDQPLRRGERLLVVLSEDSLQSGWIEQEVEAVFLRENEEKHEIIHALRVDGGMGQTAMGWPAMLYSSRSIVDFRGWNEKPVHYAEGLERLVCQLLGSTTQSGVG
ncbi:toll/interleukin-1 receptor domain-containing protein [Gloeobacter morelensis]|uniref:Toll/interleukin-1 receptor domain-containing protein n=1 Tax=Gloeobacter morelensis MG652769 TaxID=2781736 RepID=A0ABY3PN82_9CYAN|nr:toll/interleukin-1 receptor domain-containing protein [Gloeobacter morelensis]UFP95127.1 toll/interleukin-1 receptor domain-containing protein [Gloeobacter morelensis MG652769]